MVKFKETGSLVNDESYQVLIYLDSKININAVLLNIIGF